MSGCSVDGCPYPVQARGWCPSHYRRWRLYGNPLAGGPRHRDLRATLAEIAVIETDECILWPHHDRNYPAITRDGRPVSIHVLLCESRQSPRPSPQHEVAHSCGNARCVNYRHLRWATRAENMADKLQHGTHARGERNHQAKLTADQVATIRVRRADGVPLGALATEYGVTKSTISAAATGRKWGWLADSTISPPPVA